MKNEGYIVGLLSCCIALYLLFDSVRVKSMAGYGWLTRQTDFSSGIAILAVPVIAGIVLLMLKMYRIGWTVTLGGILLFVIEILSRMRFAVNMKFSHLFLLICFFAVGLGFIANSFFRKDDEEKEEET